MLALACLLAVACAKGSAAPDASATRSVTDDEDAGLVANASPPSSATSGDARLEPWPFDCSDASTLRSGKSVGHTSVVFKVELSSGKKAAWKPNARTVLGRWRGEVAAYRLAHALGLPNVPPACPRTFDAAGAVSALAANPNAAKLFASDVVVERGKVEGVVIPWIDGLRFWPLEREPLRSEARAWLTADAPIPPSKLDLARQTSDLVAFDFITGNWDRYSGENVGLDPSGSLVLFIDNDAAFQERPPAAHLARQRALLDATDRFSRSFVEALRNVDLRDAIGEETPGQPLVPETVLAAASRRVKDVLGVVDAKIRLRGTSDTLYFR